MTSKATDGGLLKIACLLTVITWTASPAIAGASPTPFLPKTQGGVLLEVHGAITNTNVDGATLFDRAMLERRLPRVHADTHAFVTDGRQPLPGNRGPLWIVYPRDRHGELQDIRCDRRRAWQPHRFDIK